MVISSYIYQNNYPQPIQIGEPDPKMLQEKQKEQDEMMSQSNVQSGELLAKNATPEVITSKISLGVSASSESLESVAKLAQASFDANRSNNIINYQQ